MLTWSLISTTRQKRWGGRSYAEAGKSETCSKWPCGKYTTTLPFFGKEIRGPAHACHSSKHTEDEAAATKGEELKTEADEEEPEEAEDGASSSSVVLRSIRPAIESKP